MYDKERKEEKERFTTLTVIISMKHGWKIII